MKSMMLAIRPKIWPLGWTADGAPIWPIFGADPEPTGETGGTTDPAAGAAGDGGGNVTAEVPPDPGATQDTAALQQQIETLTRRMMAADKAKGDIERKLREYEDQGKSDLQKAQAQVQELTEKLTQATAAATRARLEREVLKHPGYIWHDPDVVLTLIDLDSIQIDEETGKVTGVNDALKKLAASKPFLLKGKNPDGGQGGGQQQNGGKPAGSSGTNPTGGTANTAEKRADELSRKYKLYR